MFSGHPLRIVALPFTPLAWLDYPTAREPWPPERGGAGARGFVGLLSAKHFAGIPDRPSGVEMERLFRAETLTWVESSNLHHIFLCLRASSFHKLVLDGALSVYEVARTAHNSVTRRGGLAFWFAPYAIGPEDLTKVPEEEWKTLRRAKAEAWTQEGLRPPWPGGSPPSPLATPAGLKGRG